jgi:hypothetical protein
MGGDGCCGLMESNKIIEIMCHKISMDSLISVITEELNMLEASGALETLSVSLCINCAQYRVQVDDQWLCYCLDLMDLE